MSTEKPWRVFLGGADLEMAEIGRLARAEGVPVEDKGLPWGARLSDWQEKIEAAVARGERAMAIELEDDMPGDWPARQGLALVDHHGPASAGGLSSLAQAFALLGLPPARWTRRLALVDANDRGHVQSLLAMGASPAEAAQIRAEDRRAQGVIAAEEVAGHAALALAEVREGRLTVVRLPHGRMAAVTDGLALDPACARLPRDLAIISPGEFGFFGRGAAVLALAAANPKGWSGGDLPQAGFFGLAGDFDETALFRLILSNLDANPSLSTDR